jgi:hypothetical protein
VISHNHENLYETLSRKVIVSDYRSSKITSQISLNTIDSSNEVLSKKHLDLGTPAGAFKDVRYYRQLLKQYRSGKVDGFEIIGIKKRVEKFIKEKANKSLSDSLFLAENELIPSGKDQRLFRELICVVKVIIRNEKNNNSFDQVNHKCFKKLSKRFREYMKDRDLRIEGVNDCLFYSDVRTAIKAINMNPARMVREISPPMTTLSEKERKSKLWRTILENNQRDYDKWVKRMNEKMIYQNLLDDLGYNSSWGET